MNYIRTIRKTVDLGSVGFALFDEAPAANRQMQCVYCYAVYGFAEWTRKSQAAQCYSSTLFAPLETKTNIDRFTYTVGYRRLPGL